MQHIAKLRVKMAELNEAPVPDPPKRGQITSRPSSIYTSKTRALPPPPPPPPASKSRARLTRRNGIQKTPGNTTTRSQVKKNAVNRRIKRSSSDPANSEDEFDGDDGEYIGASLNVNGKRQRRAYSRRTNKHNDSTAESGMSYTESIMQNLADADARFEAEHRNDPQLAYVQDQPLFSTPATIENMSLFTPASQSFHSNLAANLGYAETIGEDEEPEEETGSPRTNPTYPNQSYGGGGFEYFRDPSQYSQQSQLSPTSTVHAVSAIVVCLFLSLIRLSQFRSRQATSRLSAAGIKVLMLTNMAPFLDSSPRQPCMVILTIILPFMPLRILPAVSSALPFKRTSTPSMQTWHLHQRILFRRHLTFLCRSNLQFLLATRP